MTPTETLLRLLLVMLVGLFCGVVLVPWQWRRLRRHHEAEEAERRAKRKAQSQIKEEKR